MPHKYYRPDMTEAEVIRSYTKAYNDNAMKGRSASGRKKVVSRRKFDEVIEGIKKSGSARNPYAVAHSRYRKRGSK